MNSDSGRLREVGFGRQEARYVGDEQRWVLKEGPMTGVWVDDQLSLRDSLSEDVRVNCGEHDVVIAVDHQRGLCDLLELREPLTARCVPLHERGSLGLGGLRRARGVDVDGALVSSAPEVPAGGPTRFGPLEEEKEVVLQGELWV